MTKFKLVKVDYNYCDYLRKFDNKVCYNRGKKILRPYLGVLFEMGEMEYFASLSSLKLKHKFIPYNLDFIKIDGGNLGAINFNNMIPLMKDNYTLIDLQSLEENYRKLLQLQLRFLNRNSKYLLQRAQTLYNKYIDGTLNIRIKNRCCDFKLLEEKCLEYHAEIKV